MRLLGSLFGAALGLVTTLACAAATASIAQAQVLRVGGTGSGISMMQQLAKPFRIETGIVVQTVPSLGSSGGYRALAAGMLDIVVAGRPPSAAEARSGVLIGATASTPFVLVTSRPTAPAFAAWQVAEIYRAASAKWPDGTPITLVMRPRAESDSELLAAAFPNMPAALEQARRRADLPVAAMDPDNAEMAERLAGSLAAGSYAHLVGEQRKVRFATIDGVAPSLETLASGAYPYRKPYFFGLSGTQSAPALRFIAFLHSDAGKAALRDAHCLLDNQP